MSSDRFFTWFNDGLEPKRRAVSIFSCVGFPNEELPNGEAEKIESHLSLIGSKCVGNACFLWTQMQTELL